MSDGVVRKWCRKFKKGQVDVHDEVGQARKSVAKQDPVKRVVRENQRFIIGE